MKYGIDWDIKSTKLKDVGIAIAPELFVVPDRIYLPNGRVVLKGTKYYTWSMAQDLVKHGYVPKGWRLPTMEDSVNISNRYNTRGVGILVLGLDGFISPSDMIAYNYNPGMNADLARRRGQDGLYWTSDLKNPLYPYVIANSGMKIRSDMSIYATYGLPMLLVKTL